MSNFKQVDFLDTADTILLGTTHNCTWHTIIGHAATSTFEVSAGDTSSNFLTDDGAAWTSTTQLTVYAGAQIYGCFSRIKLKSGSILCYRDPKNAGA